MPCHHKLEEYLDALRHSRRALGRFGGDRLINNYVDHHIAELVIYGFGVAAIPTAYLLMFQQGSAIRVTKNNE